MNIDSEAIEYLRRKLIALMKFEKDNGKLFSVGELKLKVRERIIRDILSSDYKKIIGKQSKYFWDIEEKLLFSIFFIPSLIFSFSAIIWN